jgi:hypothetical protein
MRYRQKLFRKNSARDLSAAGVERIYSRNHFWQLLCRNMMPAPQKYKLWLRFLACIGLGFIWAFAFLHGTWLDSHGSFLLA